MAEFKKWLSAALNALGNALPLTKEERMEHLHEKWARDFDAQLAAEREICRKTIESRILPEHLSVLMRKYRQTIRQDDYGHLVTDDWAREIEYYLDTVLRVGIKLRMEAPDSPEALDDANCQWMSDEGRQRTYAMDVVWNVVRDALEKQENAGLLVAFDDSMSGADFEQFCADELRRTGWWVQLIGASGDQGGDLIAEKDGRRVMLQCKKYSSPVGNTAVQEAFAGMQHHEASMACVVSNAPYTKGAQQLAASTGVLLLHHSQLCELHTIV